MNPYLNNELTEKLSDWLSDYVMGRQRVTSLTTEIKDELKAMLGWKEGEYEGDYETFGILYRGLVFRSEEEFRTFLEQIDELGRVEFEVASWTEQSNVAENFMYGEGYQHYYSDEEMKKGKGNFFGVKLSSEIEPDQIIFSFHKAIDFLKKLSFETYQKEIDILQNEGEFLVENGHFNIEIDRATPECQKILQEVLGENHPSLRFTCY